MRLDKRTALVAGAVVLGLLLLWAAVTVGRGGATTPAATSTKAATTRAGATTTAPKPGQATTTSGKATATGTRATTQAGSKDPASGLPFVDLASLPSQARDTVALIDKGGPYPYPGKDGSTYNNFNKVLPDKARGYYQEFTVPTPGESDRGARRIIKGGQGELYWTADHYDTFSRIRR